MPCSCNSCYSFLLNGHTSTERQTRLHHSLGSFSHFWLSKHLELGCHQCYSSIPVTGALGDIPSSITHQNGSILHTPWAWMLRDPRLDRVGVGLSKNIRGPNILAIKEWENDEKPWDFGVLYSWINPCNVIWICRKDFPSWGIWHRT